MEDLKVGSAVTCKNEPGIYRISRIFTGRLAGRAEISQVKDDPWWIPTEGVVPLADLASVVCPNICDCGTSPHFARHGDQCKFYTTKGK